MKNYFLLDKTKEGEIKIMGNKELKDKWQNLLYLS